MGIIDILKGLRHKHQFDCLVGEEGNFVQCLTCGRLVKI